LNLYWNLLHLDWDLLNRQLLKRYLLNLYWYLHGLILSQGSSLSLIDNKLILGDVGGLVLNGLDHVLRLGVELLIGLNLLSWYILDDLGIS